MPLRHRAMASAWRRCPTPSSTCPAEASALPSIRNARSSAARSPIALATARPRRPRPHRRGSPPGPRAGGDRRTRSGRAPSPVTAGGLSRGRGPYLLERSALLAGAVQGARQSHAQRGLPLRLVVKVFERQAHVGVSRRTGRAWPDTSPGPPRAPHAVARRRLAPSRARPGGSRAPPPGDPARRPGPCPRRRLGGPPAASAANQSAWRRANSAADPVSRRRVRA